MRSRPSRCSPPAAPAACRAESLEGRLLLAASLLRDVNTTSLGSAPQEFTDVNGTVFFSAEGPAGRELYRGDGTAAGGATLLKDVRPGPAGSAPQKLFSHNGTLFFTADDGAHGRELWKSDGTEAGTVLVKDLNPGSASKGSTPHDFVSFGGSLYFLTSGLQVGAQVYYPGLYRSDGTDAGTVRLRELPFTPLNLTAAGAHLFFAADANFGSGLSGELWASDGTEAGTALVKQVQMAFFPQSKMAAVGSGVFFPGYQSGTGVELWKSDGTAAGTVPVADINPGIPSSNPGNFTVSGGRLFFTATDAARGAELWRTDGTEAGTVLVKDAQPGTFGSAPASLTDVGGRLYFTAAGGIGKELWRSDGTDAGTAKVPFPLPAAPQLLANSGGTLFATTGVASGSARGLWKVVDAAAAAAPAPALVREFPGSEIASLAATGAGVAFAADDRVHGAEPWTSDGSADGTTMAGDVNVRTAGSASVNGLRAPVELGGRAYFPASTGPGKNGLFVTDGTPGGTSLAADLPGPITALRRLGDALLLFCAAGPSGPGLWRSDGTPEGTSFVAPVLHLPFVNRDYVDTRDVVEMDGVLYFRGDSPADPRGYELYRTDGTAAGTYRVKDTLPGGDSGLPIDFAVLEHTLYFTVFNDGIWKSDGTEAGTVKVVGFGAPGEPRGASDLAAFDGGIYFRSLGLGNSDQLWKTDGTAAGTVPVLRSDQLFAYGERALVGLDGKLVFSWPTESTRGELFASDGTAGGTRILQDINPGYLGSEPDNFLVDGGVLYFSAANDTSGRELWRTDGTPQGTFRLTDVNPGNGYAFPVPLSVIDGRLYFSATDGTRGKELWSIDLSAVAPGSPPPAPVLVQDVRPGRADSLPAGASKAGGKVVFWADDGDHGVEPWVVAPPATVAGRYVFYNRSAFDGNNPAANAADDGAIATDKRALLPRQFPDFANLTSYTRGINGIMVDLRDLPADAVLSAADFAFKAGNGRDDATWPDAPPPASVTVRRGAGEGGSDRITLTWPDGAIRNQWLRATVLPTASTGLKAEDVFFFGNLVGETGVSPDRVVNALDLVATRAKLFTAARSVESTWDFNRDGRVNAIDLAAVRANAGHQLATPGLLPLPDPLAVASFEPLRIGAFLQASDFGRKHRPELEIQ